MSFGHRPYREETLGLKGFPARFEDSLPWKLQRQTAAGEPRYQAKNQPSSMLI
ncbi:hypothetical protein [Paenibacillus zeisoli]|nr:hypothetical protein [Paenibacillus zeisoli]